jgi:hypothetical protein
MKLWGTPSPSLIQMLEGTTVSALLAKMEERNPVCYRLSQLSVELAPGTSWFDALVNAPGPKSVDVLVDGVKTIGPQSLVAVVP